MKRLSTKKTKNPNLIANTAIHSRQNVKNLISQNPPTLMPNNNVWTCKLYLSKIKKNYFFYK